ncbi:MAG TPA: TatD family hydrolase [Candidatus Paceibacterota bacterium]|nr:TatD family hydrolase [Candidatus Paceibacterota bacterium]
MKFFDAHCHLQLPEFAGDLDAVVARMRAADMSALVIGVDYETSTAAVELAEKYDFLWAVIGLHPNDNPEEILDAAAYEALAQNPKVVAIGECGLDYSRRPTPEYIEIQKKRFAAQIALAAKIGKPLIIHCRSAHEDMIEILRAAKGEHPNLQIVIHFCTVDGETAQKYIDIGCYLSFPGPITYTDMYDDSIRIAPPERILAETDSPFAAPVPFRGKRNEPVYVEHVVRKIAEVRGDDFENLRAQILENVRRIFRLT